MFAKTRIPWHIKLQIKKKYSKTEILNMAVYIKYNNWVCPKTNIHITIPVWCTQWEWRIQDQIVKFVYQGTCRQTGDKHTDTAVKLSA